MPQRTFALLFACTLLVLASCSGGANDSERDTPTQQGATSGPTAAGGPTATAGPAGVGRPVTATLSIASGVAAVGQTADVQIEAAGIGDPGLGAWTIVLKFDPDIVSITDCEPPSQGLTACNPRASSSTLRLAGASGQGLLGDVPLAVVTFRCEAAGASDLTLTAETFADATIAHPQDIEETISNGSITCS